MSKTKAFIGLNRGIMDHWIYQDAEHLKVWVEMLFCARYAKEPETKMVEGQLVVLEYGHFIFGRIKWSERLGVSERRLRTLIDKLVADNMISLVKRAPKFSVYCVTNYAKYRPDSDQQKTLEPQGIEEDGDQQNDQQTTSKRPASDQQATTKEQSKQGKQGNKVIKKHYADFVSLAESEYQKLVEEHGEIAVDAMIQILNSYKAASGKKYKSDYHTMTGRGWVLERYRKEQGGRNGHAQHGGRPPRGSGEYDLLSL